MARTKNLRAAGGARSIGVGLSALILAQTWAAAQETPTFQVRDFGVVNAVLPESALLRMPRVQEELGFTDAQKKEQEAIWERRLEKGRQIRSEIKENAKVQAAVDALVAEIEAALQANLTPEQRQRLDQVRLQLMGPFGFALPRRGRVGDRSGPLAERLKLSEDQVRRITEIVDKGITEIREAVSFPLTLDATNGPPSAEAIRKLVESPEFAAAKQKAAQAGRDAGAAVMRRIEEVLTESQRTAYHALLGAPCDLSRLDDEPRDALVSDRRMVARAYGIAGGQRADPSFDATVTRPAYAGAVRPPRVLFDEAHKNFHTASGGYKPFADLIRSDGYQVIPNREKLTREVIAKGEILVIANARIGTETNPLEAAFTDAECDTVRDWVQDGGALLLITDHVPFSYGAVPLAERFGVNVSERGATSDEANSARDATALVFSRENHLLGDHPITRGRDESERVNRVQTFAGTSLKGPEGSTLLYKLADSAVDLTFRGDKPVPAAGRCQGLALSFGKGRVVVLGEAAELSAQLSGLDGDKFGMNVPGLDNRQMALNTMHWLSGLLEPRQEELKKAG